MSSRRSGQSLVQPIHRLFDFLQKRTKVHVWLVEKKQERLEGYVAGFDEYMNTVLDDCYELNARTRSRTPLGRLMLKGDNIVLIQPAPAGAAADGAAAGGGGAMTGGASSSSSSSSTAAAGGSGAGGAPPPPPPPPPAAGGAGAGGS